MALSAGTRIGPYEILQLTGARGMGEVYRARDTRLNRDVAVKILPAAPRHDADPLARFRREAQVLASLNHPNIATVHGFEEADGLRAMVMEFVEGRTLADVIAGPGPSGGAPGAPALTLAEALDIARQIADALEAAHERPRELFGAEISEGLHTKDLSRDGSRFLIVLKSREKPQPARLTVVTDWHAHAAK